MAVPHLVPEPRLFGTCFACGKFGGIWNGAWLAYRRRMADLSQAQFAAQVGISQVSVMRIEKNRQACPEVVLDAYRALGGLGWAKVPPKRPRGRPKKRARPGAR